MAPRHLLARLEALETSHGRGGLTLAAGLRLLRDLRTRRPTFQTYEEWCAYRDEQLTGVKLDGAVSGALREILERQAGEDSTAAEKREAHERAEWRAHRAHYLHGHPEAVTTPRDHALVAERIAAKLERPSRQPTPLIR